MRFEQCTGFTTWLAATVLMSLAVGCGEEDGGERIRTVSPDECASESKWVGGDTGSELMHPGGNCIRCHSDNSEGPVFLFAGTVYSDEGAEDDCVGVEGATVVVTDQTGASVEMPTNRAGNFFVRESRAPELSPPYVAKVQYEGREATMAEPLYSTNCVDCHDGSSGGRTPPRILIPPAE